MQQQRTPKTEVIELWNSWLEAIDTWSHKFSPDVISDVRRELGCRDIPPHQHSTVVRWVIQVRISLQFTMTMSLRYLWFPIQDLLQSCPISHTPKLPPAA